MKLFLSSLTCLVASVSSFVVRNQATVTPRHARTSMEMVSEMSKVSQELRDLICKETKVCVITGASQGLGQAMAYELVSKATSTRIQSGSSTHSFYSIAHSVFAFMSKARFGQKVVVNYYPGCDEAAQETVNHIEELGGDGIAVPADCTQPDQLEKMFARIVDHYGKVDGK